MRCVSSCSAAETGREEAAGGVQQGEGAQEEEGEVRWEGKCVRGRKNVENKKEETKLVGLKEDDGKETSIHLSPKKVSSFK